MCRKPPKSRFSLLVAGGVLVAPLVAAHAATLTGTVIGEGARPLADATVEVVTSAGEPPCRTTTATDGTFSLVCGATGMHVVRASFGNLRPWEIEDVDLGPGHEVHLNFLLVPATASISPGAPSGEDAQAISFWLRPVPNPELATWQGHRVTLRQVSGAVAAVSFLLGALTMMRLGRRFGVETRSLSPDEVGELVMNPLRPAAGERVTPITTAGARGGTATVRYDATEIASALAAHRYGLVFVALCVAPALFAVSAAAAAVAMLAEQEMYLLCAMLLVPLVFLMTPVVIGAQALTRR